MSEVIQVKVEKLGSNDELYTDGKYKVEHTDQQILVKRYATPSKKKKVERKIKGHQTHDANLVYPWHRGYGKVGP